MHINQMGRRGSILVEAALGLPALVISLFLLLSLIPFAADCEYAVYGAVDQLRLEAIKSPFVQEPLSLPWLVEERASQTWSKGTQVTVVEYGYLVEDAGIEDLIQVELEVSMGQENPLGQISRLSFRGMVCARAFTGEQVEGEPAGEDLERPGETKTVYVFPRRGEKYHNRGCSHLSPAYEERILSPEVKHRFSPCQLCHSQQAKTGTMVFCFERAGEAYHLGTCSTVKKSFVAMEQKEAEQKGYTPCGTCGG